MSLRMPKRENNLTDQTDLMIRALIRHVINNTDTINSTDPEGMGVLLDTEVDGVRCLLVNLDPAPPAESAETQRDKVVLSPREEEIARMVAAGYPNKTIAAVLDISSWTVGTHLRRVFAKLGVGSRAAMVASLIKKGNLKNPC
jgi:DNA-binding CsgD family transcriptional regulator